MLNILVVTVIQSRSFTTKAKREKLGLWEETNPTPPWEYRKNKKSERGTEDKNIIDKSKKSISHPVEEKSPKNKMECGTKSTCSQMSSCSEARFYLNQCGMDRLDRDHDGIPCEKICR